MSVDVFNALLKPETIELIEKLWRVVRSWLQPIGMYEVLECDARLDLHDSKGKKAAYSKRERVRFLQDNVIAYQDQLWGDGNIFVNYRCSPGIPVDCYAEGQRYRVLISLRETKNRGDITEFHISRKIANGFQKPVEYFQTKVDHSTKKLSMAVTFPKKRPPRQLVVISQNAARTAALGPENIQTLPDGRQQVTWNIRYPKVFELYSLRWEW